MTRVRGLSNERYRERKEAQDRILKELYDGYAADPVPAELAELLDRMPR